MHAHAPRGPVAPRSVPDASALLAAAAMFQMVAALPMHVNGAYRAKVLPRETPLK